MSSLPAGALVCNREFVHGDGGYLLKTARISKEGPHGKSLADPVYDGLWADLPDSAVQY
jgi:hypothetical protein